ncbi:DUF413 domain-containing protein [Bacterioplanoides sp. SCSIO 12839]|uniref:DUF413 domain-containing protein n=1 Tax=Bacterioplanoides sp. SCSIO 12839 TaxID=2829569 RepID=UPI002104E766|nr:DUF413 domain-containing protein [Bacterioplanoides sp. SCSIO 12839]UTW47703.1 DUF413 domain-containing protein [Bacterioplanoides sp. SCSIO 12839]
MDIKSDNLTPYYDDLHFPNGFARSGHFTIKQAELLSRYGRRLSAIWRGEASPEGPVEEQFKLFCEGQKSVESEYEKAWQSYLEAIQQINRYIKAS